MAGDCALAIALIVGFDPRLLLCVQGLIAGRDRVLRRALKHEQMCGLLGDDRNSLNASRARADHADPFARKIDPVTRPIARVEPFTLKIFEAGKIRCVA